MTATTTAVAGSQPPTGTVNFKDGSNDIGCGATSFTGTSLSSSSVTSCQFILSGGTHQLTVIYNPNSPDFLTSTSGTTSITITGQPTSTAVTLSPGNSEPLGTSETFTATVSCSGAAAALCGTTAFGGGGEGAVVGSPTGTVSFYDTSSNTLLNVQPVAVVPQGNGTSTASFTTSALAQGVHPISASFTPGLATGPDWLSSNSATSPSTTYTVGGSAATFTIAIQPPTSPGPSAYQALTFTVSAVPQGGFTPAGAVQLVLTQGAVTLVQTGFVNLNNGTVTFNTAGVPAGTVNIILNYNSSTQNFLSATPVLPANYSPNSFTVTTTATNTTMSADQSSPIQYGTGVTFSATVAPAITLATGSPVPGGPLARVMSAVALKCPGWMNERQK